MLLNVLYFIVMKDLPSIISIGVYENHVTYHIYLNIQIQNVGALSYIRNSVYLKILIAYLQYVNYVISCLMLNERG